MVEKPVQLLRDKIMNCEVCNEPTDNIKPSPFIPSSSYRCKICAKEKRIPWKELLSVLASGFDNSFDDRVKYLNEQLSTEKYLNYAERNILPTLKFFGKTKEEAWEEAKSFKF